MLSKKAIWLKRVSAIFLLLVLSAVHIVQVAHSHTTQQKVVAGTKSLLQKNGLAGFTQQTPDSKCFICEYQLAKDVDVHFSITTIDTPLQHQNLTQELYSFTFQNTYSFFETRGPPQIG